MMNSKFGKSIEMKLVFTKVNVTIDLVTAPKKGKQVEMVMPRKGRDTKMDQMRDLFNQHI